MQTIKKRGKASSVYVSSSDTSTSKVDAILSPESLPSNLILHLRKLPKTEIDLNSENFMSDNILNYNPSLTTPEAYDPMIISDFKSDYSYVEGSSSVSMLESNKEEEDAESSVKLKSDKLCWWCCHNYSNESIQLPIRKNSDGVFECVGTFCSPECTCAYIMDSGMRYGDKWSEYELLHELVGVNMRISPAPRREVLKAFGGNLDISEFRSNSKRWNIVFPPMVSLKTQMDDTPYEKNDDDSNSVFLMNSNINLNSKTNLLNELPINDKKKKSKALVNGSLDRFWSCE